MRFSLTYDDYLTFRIDISGGRGGGGGEHGCINVGNGIALGRLVACRMIAKLVLEWTGEPCIWFLLYLVSFW